MKIVYLYMCARDDKRNLHILKSENLYEDSTRLVLVPLRIGHLILFV